MKKLNLLIAGILIHFIAIGQDTIKLESTIQNVIIFKKGAQIKRDAGKKINRGRTAVTLSGLTSDLDPNTIKVSATEGATVVSVLHRLNFMNKDKSNTMISNLNEDLESLVDSTDLYKKFLIVLKDEKSLLKENKKIGGSQNGVDIENLKATSVFYRERMKEIELQILSVNNKIRRFNKEIIQISRQLNELNVKREFTTSDIIVVLASKKDMNVKLEFEYFVKQAGWKPYYDIRVSDVNNPVKIMYKAKIFQNTDIDWENVNLTLSTGNPSVSSFKPVLNPYILSQRNYSMGTVSNYNETYSGYVRGKVTDDAGESLPGVSVLVKGTTVGTMTDAAGNFTIESPYESVLVFSYIGMETVEQKIYSSEINMRLAPDSEDIGEVVVTALGISKERKSIGYSVQTISGDQLMGRVSGVSVGSNSNIKIRGNSFKNNFSSPGYKKNVIPLNMKKNETNREFIIDIPYTIRSDNKEYDVSMTEFDIKADYKHYTTPKLSEKVYLTALISDYEDFGMLNGEANVFFKETYTGKTYLDLVSMTDTINLSLGIDNDVIIQREQIKEFTKSKYIGTTKKESRAWKISVKNMKDYPVELVIEDQIPIAYNNKIKVDKIEISNAIEDEDNGKLEWKLNLEPRKSIDLNLKYAVKFPSYLKIIVD